MQASNTGHPNLVIQIALHLPNTFFLLRRGSGGGGLFTIVAVGQVDPLSAELGLEAHRRAVADHCDLAGQSETWPRRVANTKIIRYLLQYLVFYTFEHVCMYVCMYVYIICTHD